MNNNIEQDNIYKILPVKDNHENYTKKKGKLWNMPFRVGLFAPSGVGKSNFIVNMFRKQFYGNDFLGENIFIFSVSAYTDDKLRNLTKLKNIPESNIFSTENDMMENLEVVYEYVKDNYLEAVENKEKPVHTCFILDDLAFSGDLKAYSSKTNIINRIMMNSRHILVNVFLSTQKASLLGTGVRTNLNGAVLFSRLPRKEVEMLSNDFNLLDSKRDFIKLYNDNTENRYSFLIINYSNKNTIYQDNNFKNILYKNKNE